MSDPAARAAQLARDPEVQRWVARFKRLAAEMPSSVWVYVASGVPHVMALSEEGTIYEVPGQDGRDERAIVASLSRGQGSWDGGDW